MIIVAQTFGILAFLVLVYAFLQKADFRTKFFLTIGQAILVVHFFLLGEPLGALLKVVSTARDGLSMTSFRRYIFIPFLIVYACLAPIMVTDTQAIYPFAGAVLALFAMYMFSGISMRCILFVATFLWLVYSILVVSYGGMLQQTFILGSIIITIYRLQKDKKSLANASAGVQ